MKKYNVAVVGATGLVEQKMIEALEERNFPVDNLMPVASESSAGKSVTSRNRSIPLPIYSQDHDETFAGRIRRDPSVENGLNLWIVSDSLRKGAATSAVQIVGSLLNTKELQIHA